MKVEKDSNRCYSMRSVGKDILYRNGGRQPIYLSELTSQ